MMIMNVMHVMTPTITNEFNGLFYDNPAETVPETGKLTHHLLRRPRAYTIYNISPSIPLITNNLNQLSLSTRKCTLWRCKSTPTPKAKLLWMTSHYGPTVVRSVTEIPFHVFI